jgi:hypothetical protein
MKTLLIELLKPLAERLFALVVAVPLPVVRVFFLGILAVLAIWLLTLPAQRPLDESGQETGGWSKDLRLYGLGLLALQSIFYIIL